MGRRITPVKFSRRRKGNVIIRRLSTILSIQYFIVGHWKGTMQHGCIMVSPSGFLFIILSGRYGLGVLGGSIREVFVVSKEFNIVPLTPI